MSLPELQQNPLVQRVIDIFDADGNGEVDFKGKVVVSRLKQPILIHRCLILNLPRKYMLETRIYYKIQTNLRTSNPYWMEIYHLSISKQSNWVCFTSSYLLHSQNFKNQVHWLLNYFQKRPHFLYSLRKNMRVMLFYGTLIYTLISVLATIFYYVL